MSSSGDRSSSSSSSDTNDEEEYGHPIIMRQKITAEMYSKAKESISREILSTLTKLQNEISPANAHPHPEFEKANKKKSVGDYRSSINCKENLMSLKVSYDWIRTQRSTLPNDNKAETQQERKTIMNAYSILLTTLDNVEADVKKLTFNSKFECEKNEKLICTIAKTNSWTRERFRRADYILTHHILRRIQNVQYQILHSKSPGGRKMSSKKTKPPASRTTRRNVMTSTHTIISPSGHGPQLSSSSDYSDLDGKPKPRENKTKRKNRLVGEDTTNRSMDFSKCKMNPDCNCYYCYPLNLTESSSSHFNSESELDTIAVLWDINPRLNHNYKLKRNNRELTAKEKMEEERFNKILKDFEKAILESKNLTFANMLSNFGSSIYGLLLKFWEFLKERSKKRNRVAPIPSCLCGENEDSVFQNTKIWVDNSYLAYDKGDYKSK